MDESNDLGAYITSKMLAAMAYDTETDSIAVTSISIDEQKRYLKKYINSVGKEDLIHIGNVLVMNDKKANLRECSEGIVINLDILPDYVILQMYEMLKHKIDKLSQ